MPKHVAFVLFVCFTKQSHADFCNWGPDGTASTSICAGGAQGGEWCNANQNQCETPSPNGCGGQWCPEFCNWGPDGTGASSVCEGGAQGGDWCNANQNQCEGGCGGRWCSGIVTVVSPPAAPLTPLPTPSPTLPTSTESGQDFCNWGPDGTGASSVCEGGAQGGDWCNANQDQCENGCGGRWCTGTVSAPTSSLTPLPTPSPTPSPTLPTSTDSGQNFCNWGPDGTGASSVCEGGAQGGEWCNANQDQCENACGGRWCTGTVSSPTSSPPYGTGPLSGKATTTRYWDCSGGACGCAYLPFDDPSWPAHCYSNAMFLAPVGNPHNAKFYGTAAISQSLGGGNWLGEGCGKCWKVTGTSNIPGYDGVVTTLVLKGTNYCPPVNELCNGKAHFDIAAPGFDVLEFSLSNTCSTVETNELDGFTSCGRWMIDSDDPNANCDCSLFNDSVLENGCNNFLSLYWSNPDVDYEQVTCPPELTAASPCWADNGNSYPNGIPAFCANPFG